MSPAEAENMAKATRMRNFEIAKFLRTIARLQDDASLGKWVLGVAAERLEKNMPTGSMSFMAYMAHCKREDAWRKDSERMDWLEKHGATPICSRESIDAAMNESASHDEDARRTAESENGRNMREANGYEVP